MRVVQLLVGLSDHIVIPQIGPVLSQRLQPVDHAVHQRFIVLPVAEQCFRALHLEIDLGIGIHGKGALGQHHKGGHRTGAQRRGAPLNQRDIQWRIGGTHDGKGIVDQGVFIVAVAGIKGDGIAHGKPALIQKGRLHQAFPVILGQASLLQIGQIEALFREGNQLDDEVVVPNGDRGVGLIAALRGDDPLLLGQGRHVLIGKPQGGEHPDIHQSQAVKIAVGGILHVGCGSAQAG